MNARGEPESTPWTVYVLVSSRADRTYVGISTDHERRLDQHNGLAPGGARSTRGGRPWRIGATFGPFSTRSQALRIEGEIKRRRGRERLSWSPPRQPAE
ncbi:MAG: GIY-YIG nuclease family protein [Planctomycetota bacterium]|nr:GIY-YIG nuclease family protein [Planctomycetota bacterium]MDP6989188.1 GIY-YIG nuclease family protein [Planctomycetota bacterium]